MIINYNFLKYLKNILLTFSPLKIYFFFKRISIEKKLYFFYKKIKSKEYFDGTVIIEGFFDNPNHWFRYILIKSALNFSNAREIGIIGKHNKFKVKNTFKNFGVNEYYNFYKFELDEVVEKKSQEILNFLKNERSIDNLVLPFNFPKEIFYDGLLRRQKRGSVDYDHKNLKYDIIEFLTCIKNAEYLLEKTKPNLLILSHAVNFDCGALAWLAQVKNISTVVIYGEYGSLRFWKPSKKNGLYMNANFLSAKDIKGFDKVKQEELKKTGLKYITKRLEARVNDIGAKKAFNNLNNVTKADICNKFNWDFQKKIIAIYSVSWIDFPHLYGRNLFLDSKKWMELTIDTICKNKKVNWIIKRHPLEKFYSSEMLDDFFKFKIPENVKLYPNEWSGQSLIKNLDGLVTFYGTAGIEAASIKKTVLTATKGWYGDCNFVFYPKNKSDYIKFLSGNWEINKSKLDTFSGRAQQFAAWHFCIPKWQKDFVLNDDFDNEKNYWNIEEIICKNEMVIRNEIVLIKKWYDNESNGYHFFKMLNTNKYKLSNVI